MSDAFGSLPTVSQQGQQQPQVQVTHDKSLLGRLKGALAPFEAGAANPVVHPVLETLSRPGQAVLQGLHPFSGTLGNAAGAGSGQQGVTINPGTLAAALKGFGHGLTNISGSDDTNLRQAENVNQVGGGIAGRIGASIADFTGSTALDPTTAIGGGLLGETKLASTGLDALRAADAGGIADKLAAGGVKALSPEEAVAAHSIISDATSPAIATKILTSNAHLAQPIGLKLAGETVLPRAAVQAVADKTGVSGVLSKVANTKGAQLINKAVNTNAGLEANLGKQGARSLQDTNRITDAAATTTGQDAQHTVQAAINKFPKGTDVQGLVSQVIAPVIHGAQDAPQVINDAATALEQSGKPLEANLLRAVHSVNAGTDASVAAAEIPKEIAPTLTHALTPQFKSFIRNHVSAARGVLGATDSVADADQLIKTAPALLAEQFAGKAPHEINDALRNAVGSDAVHDNVIGQVLQRSANAAQQVRKVNFAKGLIDVKDDAGNPLMLAVPKAGAAIVDDAKNTMFGAATEKDAGSVGAKLAAVAHGVGHDLDTQMSEKGYVKINTKAGDFYTLPTVKKYATRIANFSTDDDAQRALKTGLGKINSAYKNLTINMIPFAVPFAERNAEDNLIQMWQAGFRDVKQLVNANKFVAAINGGAKKGVGWESSLEASKLPEDQKAWYGEAKKLGIVDEAFLRTDLGPDAGIALKTGNKITDAKTAIKRGLDLSNPQSWLTKYGAAVNRRVEDTSRLAMYFDQRAKGVSPSRAADAVREGLFDYRDLTPLEKTARANGIPFYTYMRKNLPLQIRTLINEPYKVIAPERAQQELGEGNDPTAPAYYQQMGAQKLGTFGGANILGDVQTPFQGAESSLGPVGQFATGNYKQGAQGALGNVGGIVQNTIGLGSQLATGVSAFSGADTSKDSLAKQAAETELPRYTTGESLYRGLTGTPAQRLAKLSALLTGAVVYAKGNGGAAQPTATVTTNAPQVGAFANAG